MDFSMLEDIVYWNWLVLAVVLVIIEIVVAGTFFLWMSISALAVGLVLLVLPKISWEAQLTLFATFSILSIILSRIWLTKHHRDEPPSTLNRRGSQYIGRHFTLTDPIVDGVGRLNIDDTVWRVSGPNMAAGEQVVVEGMDGTILHVKQA